MGLQKKNKIKKGSRSLPYVPLVVKENPINRLPPMSFWSAFVKNGHFPAVYVGMTEARTSSQAQTRILKEWKGQLSVVEQIKSGRFKLVVRRLGIKKAL
jgi:hypothetical protein